MRMLIIADEAHTPLAVEIAQMLISQDARGSITITDEAGSGALIDSNGYTHVIKNPTMAAVLELIKRGHKLC